MGEAPPAAPEPPSLQETAETKAFWPPTIPGYDVVDRIGGGGMGDVYKGVQRGTNRSVAIKFMRRDFSSQKLIDRFDREVKLMARLNHPNIVRVYDSGVFNGIYFYVMELIEGLPLDEYIQSQNLPRVEILQLMRTIARAVQHAHQRGVIHRDLKPGNILVSADGEPHVLDFGLAKTLLDDQSMLSAAREVIGTPAMMSPEQAAGEPARHDTRSDVYTLGVMLFKFLTGEWPHDISGTDDDIMRRIRTQDIRRPRDVITDLDPDLEAILFKALARFPEDRYASAAELAADLDNFLDGDPVTARRATMLYLLGKRLRKNIRAAVAIGIGALLGTALLFFTIPILTAGLGLLILVGVIGLGYLRIRHERDEVVRQRNRTQALLRINELMNRKQELPQLLEVLLAEARQLTAADAGSLYLCRGYNLEFAVAQNQTLMRRYGIAEVARLFKPFLLPIGDNSVAGYVALKGEAVNVPDVQRMPSRMPFKFNPDFDEQNDYVTHSMLAVPIRDPDSRLLGVLHLINRTDEKNQTVRFTPEDEAIVTSLASLAAVAIRYRMSQENADKPLPGN
jgi:predicted Ser/Thr protein kinase